tara:strand:- start:37977 stop:38933 length:957 start_codon:yes stop_codon:yes gene_type:complete
MAADGMIVMGTQYDADKMVKYTQPKVNAAGGKNVGVLNKKTSKSTILSAPLMMTWGVNEWKDDASGKVSYDLSLQFPDADNMSDNVKKFLDNLIAFENKIKSDAAKFSREWFNKPSMSPDVVDALFTPMLRYPKNKETMEPDYSRSPSLKVKVPYWEGDFKTEIYDMKQNTLFPDPDGTQTPLDLIGKGSQIASIIKNGGIWFAAGKFGTTWKLEQAVVQPRATLRGKCHIQLDETEMQTMETAAAKSDSDSDGEQEKVVDTNVEDSDDDEPEPEPEPAPVQEQETPAADSSPASPPAESVTEPTPKKKRVVKKKTDA